MSRGLGRIQRAALEYLRSAPGEPDRITGAPAWSSLSAIAAATFAVEPAAHLLARRPAPEPGPPADERQHVASGARPV
ncbi:hypothetical protein ACFFMN_27935 [Planobispora siamensis]|uniref:Uncharacterized protein n=1 Tax=Planobispora siamensis TaxID=936338 RepID=A0A8J3SSG0_9ACTN|nr:hypothetical protein [Planobispora siamensis]GIH97870.1 hypothetical protein Psi01_85000 [Planobispora siamensis]